MMEMYFVAVLLPPKIDDKVKVYKNWMKEKWNCKVGLKSPAHITIIPPFWMNAHFENKLVNAIATISSAQQTFEMQTTGFDAFKPRTLFIAVAHNESLYRLKIETEYDLLSNQEFGLKKENRPFNPHITIATRDVQKAQFYEAWDHFKEKEFSETWQAEGLSILKHNKKNWDVIYTSQLNK